MTEEERRLLQARNREADWKYWGPYLSERAWGTVREDYSPDGAAWDYLTHDQARSKAYRWNEDGLLGICDRQQHLCFALALWNGNDPILKERLFGLSGSEGNHGEDVKEYYFFLDSTPTHSYMKALYKYPQAAFPYGRLVEENRRRGRDQPEFELIDTCVFADNRYFDIFVEYAKVDPEDILIRITAVNRGPEAARLDLLPTLWFRNIWAWHEQAERPQIKRATGPGRRKGSGNPVVIQADSPHQGKHWLFCQANEGEPELLFTNNESNYERLYPPNGRNETPYVKDGIDAYVVSGKTDAVNPQGVGTKFAARYKLNLQPGEEKVIRLRLSRQSAPSEALETPFEYIFDLRKREADAFYATVAPEEVSEDARNVQRQAFAGLLWSKQFYHYNVLKWLQGDPTQMPPPPQRWVGRNHNWKHLDNASVLSMPDSWEYPWYAAWDLAFHCISLALVDSDFAKNQLLLLLREWYMHPNGQLPAYEWAFGDVNPPVHAWAAMRVYQIERRLRGVGDRIFLERVFHKLLLNFTWWVNRKDAEGRNVFQGGFLGLDNIGLFDRSKPLPTGGHIDQSDGTSWMAMYCLNMLAIALELAREDDAYEDVATKFLEHFFYIAHAMNDRPSVRFDGTDMWDEDDGFYYDVLHLPDDSEMFLRVRSLVGLIPLLAVETLDPEVLEKLPDFRRRLEWFTTNRQDLCRNIASVMETGMGERRLFAVVPPDRLRAILAHMLDEAEFLAPTGIRSLSRFHKDQPFCLTHDGMTYQIDYEPAESTSGLFGGNSNWRGPVWFPINYLLIEALQKFDYYYGSELKVEYPTGSGKLMTLWDVSVELSRRLIHTFLREEDGRRPVFGSVEQFQTDPLWRDYIPFHEYFHGDTGAGLGASHQTGWTALVAKLIQQSGE
ncbi:MAG TPA: glucosidase [Chthonomonadaceae bacterium]|nr:glucosidase [Chthonomonadaceae bacterium]